MLVFQICSSCHVIRVKRISSRLNFCYTAIAIVPNRSCIAERSRGTRDRVYNSLEKSAVCDIKKKRTFFFRRHDESRDILVIIELRGSEISIKCTRTRDSVELGLLGKRMMTNGANLCERKGRKEREKEQRITRRDRKGGRGGGDVFTLHLWIYSCIHGRALRDDTRLSRAYQPPTSNSVHSNVSPVPRRRYG